MPVVVVRTLLTSNTPWSNQSDRSPDVLVTPQSVDSSVKMFLRDGGSGETDFSTENASPCA